MTVDTNLKCYFILTTNLPVDFPNKIYLSFTALILQQQKILFMQKIEIF